MIAGAALKLSTRVSWSIAAFGASLALAAAAAHWYETPHLSGTPEVPIWAERDVLCAAAAAALALALAASARSWATRRGAIAGGSPLLRVALWALFSLVLLGIWGHWLSLLAFLVAPSQAFALVRLLALISSWQSEIR